MGIGAAKQVAGSTAQLLLACKVKADPDSQPMRRLEDASNAVRKATENLVKAAQSALDNNANDDHLDLSEGDVGGVVQQINARAEVLRMERELEEARKKLAIVHQRRYQTDSEQSEQSGYESSGYDEASFRKVYHSSPYPKKLSTPKQSFQQQSFTSQQQHQVMGDHHHQQAQQTQQHTIESGPSFNESLERFRLATSSGGESDGESHLNQNQQQSTSVFRQSRSTSSSTQKTSSNLTSRSVEEQRTIITRNSQKSYHIE